MVYNYERKARDYLRTKYGLKGLLFIGGGTLLNTGVSDAHFVKGKTNYFCTIHTNGRVYVKVR